ncbi:hypothetical protein [Fulvitalea axinellae]
MKFSNSKDFLNKLNTKVFAFISIHMAGFLVLYIMQENGTLKPLLEGDARKTADTASLVLLVVFFVLGYMAHAKEIKKSLEVEDLREKLLIANTATIKKYIYFTVGALCLIAGFAVSAQPYYAGVYALTLIVVSTSIPSAHRIARKLKLDREQGLKVLDNDPID